MDSFRNYKMDRLTLKCPEKRDKITCRYCRNIFYAAWPIRARIKCPRCGKYTPVYNLSVKMEEKRGFTLQGRKYRLTLTELRNRLDGTPTKHVLAVWDNGKIIP